MYVGDMVGGFVGSVPTRILLIIVAALIAQRFSHTVIGRLVRRAVQSVRYQSKTEEKKREDTLTRIFNDIVTVAVWIVAILVILSELDVNIAALATGAGLVGILVGFGAQNAIRDYLAGVFIILENQYCVGDVVSLAGGTSGIVEDITIRITKLRDLDGSLHIVRNGDAGVVTNMTSSWSRALIDVQVGWDADLDKVKEIINKVGSEMAKDEAWRDVITKPVEFYRVDGFTDSAIIVKALGETMPIHQWDVAGEFRHRIKAEFEKHGIERPYPQRVIHETAKSIKKGKV